jgi:glutamine amidotransferase/cyclase
MAPAPVAAASAPLAVQLRRRGCSSRSSRSCHPARRSCAAVASSDKEVWLLDYGAGNVRSVRNAIRHLGYTVRDVASPADLAAAPRLVFPGVGAFGTAMEVLRAKGYVQPLKDYVQARPYRALQHAACAPLALATAEALAPPARRRAARSSASAWACSCSSTAARRAAAARAWA